MSEQAKNISISISNEEVTLEEKLNNLPDKPGVYQFKDAEGKLLYIGKAVVLKNRVRQYFHKSRKLDPRIEAMVSKIKDVELIATDSEIEALMLEATLIKKFKPRYNVDLKDDKSYPFIVVTNEPYPRVFVTRRIIKDGSKYFGPYTDVKTMRASLKMIRDVFKVRSCNYLITEETIKKKKFKICLDYHIKKCEGPCEGLVSHIKYNEMIREVMQVIKGKTTSLVFSLEEQMATSADELRFEEAAELRDKIRQLTVHTERQKIIDADLEDRDLFAIAIDGNDACGVVFKVREGKLIGKQHVYMSGVEHKPLAEITEQF
ncbi:MAG: excinuclease ABC subunit C, partial [Bacteroidetes bacterium]